MKGSEKYKLIGGSIVVDSVRLDPMSVRLKMGTQSFFGEIKHANKQK